MTRIVRSSFLAMAFAVAVAVLVPFSAHAQSGAAKQKAVFQVSDSDPQKWNLALNNAKNVQADLGVDKTEIEIVAYGPGIGMLKADAIVANALR